MIGLHIAIALQSIRRTRARSFFTMLGVVIGVAAVVVAVNIGQGVRNQVNDQIESLDGNLISVRSGNVVSRDQDGNITNFNLSQALSSPKLTQADVEKIRQISTVSIVAPLAEIGGTVASASGQTLTGGQIIATSSEVASLLGKDILYGSMFENAEGRRAIVVGIEVAEKLFNDPSPLGKVITIKNQDFVIRGVFDRFQLNPINFGTDYNRTVFVPLGSLRLINEESPLLKEILLQTTDIDLIDETIAAITAELSRQRQAEDFTVLKQSDLQFITDDFFDLVTGLVAAIAGISLVVGGIGIMNIMLVSVAERTREIGIRKAIGASNSQIMIQFLTESVILSSLGGIIGITLAEIIGLILRSTTSIKPVFDINIVLLAIAASALVGIVFGVGPAWKAARKQPIQALRS